MKTITIAAIFATLATGAFAQNTIGTADAYHLGAGSWKCERLVAALTSQTTDLDRGQAAGWILGFWSAVTVYEDSAFVDKIEAIGGSKILEATFEACKKEPNKLVGVVSKKLVESSPRFKLYQ